MKLSTRTRYAMRLMIDLAHHWDDGYIALKDIAERQDISKKYLEQIVSRLTSEGLVTATRGFSGGYRLSRHPKEITAADIMEATESSLSAMPCLDDASCCPRCDDCDAYRLWRGLDGKIREYLRGASLQDVVDQSRGRK